MERAAQRLTQSIGYIGASDGYGYGYAVGMWDGELIIEISLKIQNLMTIS